MKKRGFALLSPERRRELARLGGKACQASGKAHRWTEKNGKAIGRLGGLASQRKKREKLEAS
jgi:hypothetical protein